MKNLLRISIISVSLLISSSLKGQVLITLLLGDALNTGKIEFGLLAGAAYKFQKKIKSMSAGINYYYGLVDVSKNPEQKIKNSAIYFYLKIPIGAGEKKE